VQAVQAPLPSHTMPTPQLVPAVLLAPSVQVVALPLQVVLPCLHGLGLPVQLWFATHAPQKPLPSHICPPVQVAVAGLGVPSTQVDAPVKHEVTPFRQIDGLVVHADPAVHATQVPVPLHTRFVPQVVPAAVLPESRQRGAPLEQSTTPVLHGAPGFMLHALPSSHVTHWPLPLHTMAEPQAVPAATLSPSMQLDAVPQETTPSLQAPPGLPVQTVPPAQLTHAPALQILSAPHDVPSVTLASSRHWGAPLEQAIAPFLQGLPGLVVQAAPVAQGMQVPAALHTWPVPQLAPGVFAAAFMHPTGSHTVMPLRHWSLLVAQATPAMQALHVPLKHSMLLPQAVPSRAAMPSSQVGPSAPHAIRPTLQGAPGLVSHACAIGHPAVSWGLASKLPELTAASTMPPTWSGVRPSVQPGTLQQTPMVTDAELTCSQVRPDGHLGAFGSHSTRAVGTSVRTVQAAPSSSAAAMANDTTNERPA